MKFILVVAFIILIALIGSRRTFTRLRLPLGAQYLFLTGTEYLFVGVFLGSSGIDLFDAATLEQLRPFMSLGLAWVGLLFGIQLQHRQLIRFPLQYTLIAFNPGPFYADCYFYSKLFASPALLPSHL